MELELIQNKDYILLIDRDNRLKVGDKNVICVCFDFDEPYLVALSTVSENDLTHVENRIIAYRKLKPEAEELNLPLLPSLKEAVFSLEDVKKLLFVFASEAGSIDGEMDVTSPASVFKWVETYSYKHLPKNFIPKTENRCCGRCDGNYDLCVSDIVCEEHKETSCESCFGSHGDKLKTIINSDGKEELVGEYIY